MKKTYPSIPGLEPDAWSNDACRGYVIMAMQDCGFSHEDIPVWYGSFTKPLTSIPSTRPSRNIIMATIDLGPCWPEAGESSKSGTFRGAVF